MATEYPSYVVKDIRPFADDVRAKRQKLIIYVVGAGASRAMHGGYPLGQDLATTFKDTSAQWTADLAESFLEGQGPGLDLHRHPESIIWCMRGGGKWNDVARFATEVNRYFVGRRRWDTIDAFLNVLSEKDGDEFRDAYRFGRFALAVRLYHAEAAHLRAIGQAHGIELKSASYGGTVELPRETWDWLSPVMDRVLADNQRDDSEWRHAFVTFNYDRSVEYALGCRYAQESGEDMEVATVEMSKLAPVLHVHGALYNNAVDWPAPGYGSGLLDHMDEGSNLQFVGQSEEDFRASSGIAQLMNAATRVVFLGFGYDERNLSRIRPGSKVSHKNKIKIDIFGTMYKMHGKRDQIIHSVASAFGQEHPIRLASPDDDCMSLITGRDLWGAIP